MCGALTEFLGNDTRWGPFRMGLLRELCLER